MRTIVVRLSPGSDLKAELARLAQAHALRAGFILSCAASLSHARLRMPSAVGEPETYRTFVEPLEIVSLTGTLSPDGLHVHVSLSRRDGACIGGHLAHGCIVHTTAELVIGEAPELEFRRLPDPVTGYAELNVRPRSPPGDLPDSEP